MWNAPCPVGRTEAVALATMNIRVVIGQRGLSLVARPKLENKPGAVGPKYQPRDSRGHFVPYRLVAAHLGAGWPWDDPGASGDDDT